MKAHSSSPKFNNFHESCCVIILIVHPPPESAHNIRFQRHFLCPHTSSRNHSLKPDNSLGYGAEVLISVKCVEAESSGNVWIKKALHIDISHPKGIYLTPSPLRRARSTPTLRLMLGGDCSLTLNLHHQFFSLISRGCA